MALAIDGEFEITLDSRRIRDVVRASDYVHRAGSICQKRFPNRIKQAQTVTLVMAHCVNAGASMSWMIQHGSMAGLWSCLYEDMVFFGEQHPEVQLRYPIVGTHAGYSFKQPKDQRLWHIYLKEWYDAGRAIHLIADVGPYFSQTRFLFRKLPVPDF